MAQRKQGYKAWRKEKNRPSNYSANKLHLECKGHLKPTAAASPPTCHCCHISTVTPVTATNLGIYLWQSARRGCMTINSLKESFPMISFSMSSWQAQGTAHKHRARQLIYTCPGGVRKLFAKSLCYVLVIELVLLSSPPTLSQGSCCFLITSNSTFPTPPFLGCGHTKTLDRAIARILSVIKAAAGCPKSVLLLPVGDGAAPLAWSKRHRAWPKRRHRIICTASSLLKAFPPLRKAMKSKGVLNTTCLAEQDLSSLWHSRKNKHVLKLEKRKVLAQAGRKTQQELLLFIFFNSIETLLLSTRCIYFQDANKFQAITFA